MNQDKIFRLKKYLFFISVFVFVPIFSHLVYTYLYSDSKIENIKWWIISEAIIWTIPKLNPLKPLSGDNRYIANLLYRSLLRYDVLEKKIKSDIATCDLSNLLTIKCYIKDDVKWSNGDSIKAKDIIATYKIYKNSDINPIMSTLLSKTEIKEENNYILFSSSESHVKFLDVFFNPIIPESIINKISLDDSKVNFFSSWWIYSWKYVFDSLLKDDKDWIVKLNLIKNKYYIWNNINIEKLVLNFFPTSSDFFKHKEGINLFNDNNNILWNSVPRLENNSFYLPQYVSLFINKDNIWDENLRNYIFNKISRENLIKILWDKNFREIKNPYLTDISIDKEIKDRNISKILSNLGYYKKSDLLSKFTSKISTWTFDSTWLLLTWITSTWIVDKVYSIDKFQEKSIIFINPINLNKYNFITKDDILLQWKAWKDVKEVYVNDYKLNWFKSWNDIFYYRIKEGVKNIKQWINKYSIYFNKNWKKELVEEIFYIYYKNSIELDKQKEIFIKGLYWIVETQESSKIESLSKSKSNSKIQTEKEKKELEEKIKKVNSLEDKYFYNDKLEKLSYDLVYVNSEKDIELTANYIKNSLTQEWIVVNMKPINIDQLTDFISNEEDLKEKNLKYDMILVAINLWNFDFDIFSYFHSSKVNHKPKSNFSKIKKSDLDSLLEKLESSYLEKEGIFYIEEKVLWILKNEQVVKILYTPLINNLVDKNIKDYNNVYYIPDKSFRNQLIENIYVINKKILNLENKWFIWFVKFLLKSLNE